MLAGGHVNDIERLERGTARQIVHLVGGRIAISHG
jgi:hypothetical protein